MEHSLKYSWSLRRTPDGPLAPYIDGFKGRLCTLGYAETSAHLYTRLAADFSGWLKQKNVAKEEITPEHTLRYLRYRARRYNAYSSNRRCAGVTSMGVLRSAMTPFSVSRFNTRVNAAASPVLGRWLRARYLR